MSFSHALLAQVSRRYSRYSSIKGHVLSFPCIFITSHLETSGGSFVKLAVNDLRKAAAAWIFWSTLAGASNRKKEWYSWWKKSGEKNHLGCIPNLVNNGILTMFSLNWWLFLRRISEPAINYGMEWWLRDVSWWKRLETGSLRWNYIMIRISPPVWKCGTPFPSVTNNCHLYRWWFQVFFMFTLIWGRFPFWRIFFRWVETTN